MIGGYIDTDSVTKDDCNKMKLKLNSIYGSAIMNNKNFIVVHKRLSEEMMTTGIIFKDKILGVFKNIDNTACISTQNCDIYVLDNYNDIIKQLI